LTKEQPRPVPSCHCQPNNPLASLGSPVTATGAARREGSSAEENRRSRLHLQLKTGRGGGDRSSGLLFCWGRLNLQKLSQYWTTGAICWFRAGGREGSKGEEARASAVCSPALESRVPVLLLPCRTSRFVPSPLIDCCAPAPAPAAGARPRGAGGFVQGAAGCSAVAPLQGRRFLGLCCCPCPDYCWDDNLTGCCQ